MTKPEALEKARELSRRGRKHVAREDHGRYFVCPLYELDREGQVADAGYAGLGVLVKESL